MRLVGLLVLVLGLLVVLVVDVDGDPSTTNVTSAVLGDETAVAAHTDACHDATEPTEAVGRRKLCVLRRKVGEWLGNQHRWHPRVGPIRGP